MCYSIDTTSGHTYACDCDEFLSWFMDVGFVVAFPLHHELDSEEVLIKDHVATLIAYDRI